VRQLLLKIFLFPFAVTLSFIFLSGCEKKYDTVIDSAGSAPFISHAAFSLRKVYSDTMYNGQGLKKPDDFLTIRGIVSTKVVHPEGLDRIASVRFNLTENQTSSIVNEGILYDDGISPDKNALDSLYTQLVEYQFGRVFVGKQTLSLWSVDKSGNPSNVIYLPLEILRRDNQKPILSDLQMDSLVAIGGDDQVLNFYITATDLDGQSDIYRVYFNSFIPPNGTPSTSNPFFMYDDGDIIHRDVIAGDGVYSLAVKLPKTTKIGTYRFEFHAIDRSLDSSNVTTRTIVITN
jgi:hypothetical protein